MMLRIEQQQPEQWQIRPFGLNPVELEAILSSEDAALQCITAHKWPDGKVQCRHCGSDNTRQPASNRPTERYSPRYVCRDCGNKSTALSGTALQTSEIPLSLWMRAIAAYAYRHPTPDRAHALRRHIPQLTELQACEIPAAIAEAVQDNRRVYETIAEAERRRPPAQPKPITRPTQPQMQGSRLRTPSAPPSPNDEIETIIAQLELRRDRLNREIELKSHELSQLISPLTTVTQAKSLLVNWRTAGVTATTYRAQRDTPPAGVV